MPTRSRPRFSARRREEPQPSNDAGLIQSPAMGLFLAGAEPSPAAPPRDVMHHRLQALTD